MTCAGGHQERRQPSKNRPSTRATEHLGDHLRVGDVGLAFQRQGLRPREAGDDRVRGLVEEVLAAADDHQDGLGDPGKAEGGRLAVAETGRVVGQRVRDRLQAGPQRRAPRAATSGSEAPASRMNSSIASARRPWASTVSSCWTYSRQRGDISPSM
jgi:hypothetical protein